MTQVVPQWQIQQTFASTLTAAVDNLYPLLLGPDFAVRRYSATGKTAVSLGTYAAAADLANAWPGLVVGETVDQTYTAIIMENAALRYGNSATVGTQSVAGRPNRINNAAVRWATGNGYARTSEMLADARVGDAIRLTYGSNILVSTIAALVATPVAMTIGTPAIGASNLATTAGSATYSRTGNTGTATVPANDTTLQNAANWNATGSVALSTETYTITVTGAGADCQGNAGAWTSLVLTVTNASGTEATQTISGTVSSGVAFAIGTRGAYYTLTHGGSGNDFVVGDVFTLVVTQAYTRPTFAAAGTYTGSLNTTYVVRVTRGGSTSTGTKAQISVTTTQDASSLGIDSGGPYTVTSGSPIVIGNLGVTFTLTGARLIQGDQFTIAVTAAGNGAINALDLTDPLPAAMQSQNLNVEIASVETITVPMNRTGAAPLVNWTQTASLITLKAGITMTSTYAASAGQLPVLWGNGYVTYRALRGANANQVISVATEADALAFFGAEDIDGGISYAVRRALSNGNGQPIKCLAVPTDDLAGYNLAMTYLTNREDFYRVVPLTQNEAIIDAVIAMVNQRSGASVGRWATVMASFALNTTVKKVGSPTTVATIVADTTVAGNPIQALTDTLGQFVALGIRAGDTVRYNYVTDGFGNLTYSTATVNAVLSNQVIQLAAPLASAITPAAKYEIWRTLTLTEQVADWGARVQARANRRVTAVWPPAPGRVGTTVPSYNLAASLAALRCSVSPHQGLTNAAVADWDNLSQSSSTFANFLDTLANYGAYIVTQSPAGAVYVRKQLTTDLSDVKHAEDSATVNYDSVSYYFKQLLANTTGRTNVVPSNLRLIRAALDSGINALKSNLVTQELGGQITDGSVTSITPDPVAADKVQAVVNVSLPIPLNNGNLMIVA